MLIRFLLPFWKVLDDQNKLWFTLQLCQQTKDHESPGAGGGQWRWESENIVVWWWWWTLSLSDELHHSGKSLSLMSDRRVIRGNTYSGNIPNISTRSVCTVYSVQCTVYSVYSVHCTSRPGQSDQCQKSSLYLLLLWVTTNPDANWYKRADQESYNLDAGAGSRSGDGSWPRTQAQGRPGTGGGCRGRGSTGPGTPCPSPGRGTLEYADHYFTQKISHFYKIISQCAISWTSDILGCFERNIASKN